MDNKKRFIAVGVTGGPYTTWGVVDTTTDEWRISDDYYAPQARKIAQFLNEHPDASDIEIERCLLSVRPSDRRFYTDPQYAERMATSPLYRDMQHTAALQNTGYMLVWIIIGILGLALFVAWVLGGLHGAF